MTPTPTQALLLFGLTARHGQCPQAELMPAVKRADREALEKAKLVAVGKVGRGLGLTLTDDGWAWTAAHLDAALPPAHRALSDMLSRLGEHLSRTGGTLADVIGARTDAGELPAQPAKKKPAIKPAARGKAKAPTQAELRKRIEAAYIAQTRGRKNEMVRLAHLRAELADLDRAVLDGALGRILAGDKQGAGKASLMRHDDPRQLAKADHDAAFAPSGEPFHVLWIAS